MRTNYFLSKGELTMRFILGVLWGYYIRGRKRLLIITLTVFTVLVLVFAVCASRNRPFHSWPRRDARTSFTTAANLCAFACRVEL
jgi:hypothetical protein